MATTLSDADITTLLHETNELRKPPEKRRAEKLQERADRWAEQNPDVIDSLLSFTE